jgi:hypothetical protein
MTPILLLEINEVPWRLIDRYIDRPEYPHIRAIFSGSHHFTSRAVDTGELSPWVTWPTLHRGMNNEQHGIRNLGQDPSTFKGKPIWQDVREAGGSIGICGSMQSWPPIDPGLDGFFIPDTFAHDEACIPNYLNPLQAFNLDQVRNNARVVSDALPPARNKLALISALVRSGIRARTIYRIMAQLIGERFDSSLRLRRPIYQTVLFWDVFRKQFNSASPPAFSTFFTNHIAGVMHRYWCDVFPEDFPDRKPCIGESQEPLMRFALRVLDHILADVLAWARTNPDLVVIFASSMGQGAVYREHHEGIEIVVKELPTLMHHAGLDAHDYRPLLAMVPQIAVEVHDPSKRKNAKVILESTSAGNGEQFIRVKEVGVSLSITVGTPSLDALNKDQVRIGSRELSWDEAGLRREDVEPGTGYHVPEGTLMVYSSANATTPLLQNRMTVHADKLKSWMLDIIRHGPSQIVTLGRLALD